MVAVSSAPTISSISPSSGAVTGNTFVTISGTNFTASGLIVTVGGVALTSPIVVNATTITGYTGAHAAATVDVYVQTIYGNATAVGAFTYSAVTLAWFSDWRTATGQTNSALQDGADAGSYKWPDILGTTLINVVSASGLGFPAGMTNVLRVDGNAGAGSKVFVGASAGNVKWNLPAVGEYIFYRYYHRSDMPDNMPNVNHHLVENHTGDIAWNWLWSGNAMLWEFHRWADDHPSDPNSYADEFFRFPSFAKGEAFRVEWRLYRDTTNTAQVQLRVYDNSGALLDDNDGFLNSLGTLTQRIAASGVQIEANTTDDLRRECFQSLNVGQNGNGGSNWTPGNYMYFGGVATTGPTSDSAAWIGAYPTGGE